MKARKIYESPDTIALPDLRYNAHGEDIEENPYAPAFGDANSYAFWYESDEFVLGNEHGGHPTNIRNYKESYSGRVWADKKLISFWIYPSKFQFQDIANELSKKLSLKGYDADILNDPEWKVEILPSGMEWRGNSGEFRSQLVSASDYQGSMQRSPEDLAKNHMKTPNDPTKRRSVPYNKRKTVWDRMKENKFVPDSLDALFEFERGQEPGKAMEIGKHSKELQVHRCGHCGVPTDEHGTEFPYESDEFNRTIKIINDMNDSTSELTVCNTCHHDLQREENRRHEEYEAEAQREWEEEQNRENYN